jgi:hypothetical protein
VETSSLTVTLLFFFFFLFFPMLFSRFTITRDKVPETYIETSASRWVFGVQILGVWDRGGGGIFFLSSMLSQKNELPAPLFGAPEGCTTFDWGCLSLMFGGDLLFGGVFLFRLNLSNSF